MKVLAIIILAVVATALLGSTIGLGVAFSKEKSKSRDGGVAPHPECPTTACPANLAEEKAICERSEFCPMDCDKTEQDLCPTSSWCPTSCVVCKTEQELCPTSSWCPQEGDICPTSSFCPAIPSSYVDTNRSCSSVSGFEKSVNEYFKDLNAVVTAQKKSLPRLYKTMEETPEKFASGVETIRGYANVLLDKIAIYDTLKVSCSYPPMETGDIDELRTSYYIIIGASYQDFVDPSKAFLYINKNTVSCTANPEYTVKMQAAGDQLSLLLFVQQSQDGYNGPRLESTTRSVYDDAILTYTQQKESILKILDQKKAMELDCNKDVQDWSARVTSIPGTGTLMINYPDRVYFLNAQISKPFLG